MRIPRRLALVTSSAALTAVGLALAQDLPRAPSKSLPEVGGPAAAPGRVHTSPATRATYAIRTEPEDTDSDIDDRQEISPEEAAAVARELGEAPGVASVAAAIPASEFYKGSDRKAAKLSIAQAPIVSFDDVNDLLGTLPSKDAMAKHNPPITTQASSNRVAEEKRNVRVRCWLYAASKEADNDFHLILGRAPGLTPPRFMTMELAGLPPKNAASFPTLKAARDAFHAFFSSNLPGTGYDFYDPPIPVLIEGSLFFDMTHAKGTPPGPVSLRPNMPVIWEVHPITRIVFEPSP